MPTRRHRVPPWLMGLANLTYGMYGGVLLFAVPQLLNDRHVPESTIASLTAVGVSPGFWAFLFSPILDVRFSRRWYAVVLGFVAAATVIVVILNPDHLALVEVALTVGFFAAYLYQSALGGWLSSICTQEEEKTLSTSITIGNVSGFGVIAIVTNQLVSHLSPLNAGLVLAGMVLLPMAMFPFMQAPGPDRRLASESFPQFFGDLVKLVRQRDVLIAVVLFVVPAATFSLSNFLGGVGADFAASPEFVGLIGGVGVMLAGIAGSVLFQPLSRFASSRKLYVTVGLVGSVFTAALALAAHTPASFALALIVENVLQSLAITASMAIIFDTIGRDNPLASTTFCFVGSAYGVPISYMLLVDGAGYKHAGLAGSFLYDGLAGVGASALLAGMLLWLARKQRRIVKPAV